MIKPIATMFYCYVWINSNNALPIDNKPISIHESVTVNKIITNESMYDINKLLESIFIKEE